MGFCEETFSHSGRENLTVLFLRSTKTKGWECQNLRKSLELIKSGPKNFSLRSL